MRAFEAGFRTLAIYMAEARLAGLLYPLPPGAGPFMQLCLMVAAAGAVLAYLWLDRDSAARASGGKTGSRWCGPSATGHRRTSPSGSGSRAGPSTRWSGAIRAVHRTGTQAGSRIRRSRGRNLRTGVSNAMAQPLTDPPRPSTAISPRPAPDSAHGMDAPTGSRKMALRYQGTFRAWPQATFGHMKAGPKGPAFRRVRRDSSGCD